MEITKDILYVGVNDHEIDLFEGQYEVPLGMAYNSYLIVDEHIAVMDSVEAAFGREWLENIERAAGGRTALPLLRHLERIPAQHAAQGAPLPLGRSGCLFGIRAAP